jgi:hypothetical protein
MISLSSSIGISSFLQTVLNKLTDSIGQVYNFEGAYIMFYLCI